MLKGKTLRSSKARRASGFKLIALAIAPSFMGAANAAPDNDIDGIMARVIAANKATLRGVVGYQSDGRLRIGAGFYHRSQQERRWFVLSDGTLSRTGIRAGSDAPFGKDAESQSHEPWGPYATEYRFTDAPCPHCAAGLIAVAFASTIHDTQHSKGVMLVDIAHDRVVHETQEPYVLRGTAKTGEIELDFGDTGVGWLPRELRGTFTGNVGPFSGAAHLIEAFDDYRRYSSTETAASALAS